MAQKYIIQHRRGTLEEWTASEIIPYAGELVVEIDEENNLHKLKIGDGIHAYNDLAYLKAGDEIVSQVLAQALPHIVTVTLNVNAWEEVTDITNPNVGCYSQIVNIPNVGECCRLDLQPDINMLAELKSLGIVFTTENKGGTITVYSIGIAPLKTYTMQASLVETELVAETEGVLGLPVGSSTIQASNPNIFRNGDFKVNQRGQTEYNITYGYCVDGWILNNGIINVGSNNITLTPLDNTKNCALLQAIRYEELKAGTYTVSVNTTQKLKQVYVEYEYDGEYYQTKTIKTDYANTRAMRIFELTDTDINRIKNSTHAILRIGFIINNTLGSNILSNAKLELGSVVTAFYPRPYSEELAICQRYYQRLDFIVNNNVSPSQNVFAIVGSGTVYSSTLAYITISLAVTPRAQGTFEIDTNRLSDFVLYSNGVELPVTEIINYAITPTTSTIRITTSGATVGSACWLKINNPSLKPILAYNCDIY